VQAIHDYNKAVEIDRNFALAYKNRGLVYRDSGSLQLAVADFERYLELAPNASDQKEMIKLIEKLKAKLKND
jgi:tetratricopeptide (TPR) repeat protein